MKRPNLPEPDYYAIPDLAHVWGVSIERIRTYAEAGATDGSRLEIRPCGPNAIDGVTPAEKARFESLGGISPRFPEGRFHPSDRSTHQALLAALLLVCFGKSKELTLGPYELAGLIEKDAAGLGLALDRSQETNAKILREVQLLLKQASITKGIQSEGGDIQSLDRAA